ncbi:hypothetical protein O3G_MSEX007165 [Manduca sexta]|uniref:Reverse transcriptase domain-containing protein n=1 Tax=Manduca sexta TaxID=7130 RepID=A0A921Z4Z2_MANSE|nr:hypothetical protein O3G_MSEX007165 [Manduca sexta]
MPPLDRPNQRPAFDDDEKAELLASSLESQCSLTDTPVENDIVVAVDTYVESRNATPPPLPTPRPLNINQIVAVGPDVDSPPLDPLAPVTTEEVIILIKALKRRKAPGADGIPNRLLKMLPEHLVKILAAIFNAAFQNCIFPEAWKEAVVIGIHKPGKPASSPTSYRPISLLSSLGKLYERIVLDRLKIVAHLHNLLPPEQFGFRSRHNCVHQVLRITEHVYTKRRYDRPTGAIFFDVEKAFDKVWHNGLLFKLYTLNVPTQLVHIIRDFLSNRGFKYRVEGTLSSRHTISAGVPQGSALSPFLFSLYTSDIPSFEDAHLALFADDTAIYASHRNPDKLVHILQSAADLFGAWCRRWRITINPAKSQAIVFTRHTRVQAPLASIVMSGQAIPWTRKVKYLGVLLDQKLTFVPHVNAVRARAALAMSQLHWLINKNSKLSTRNKIRIFTSCIRPIMTYASPAFAHIPPARLQRMQVLQNQFLRRALGAPWYVRNRNLHVDTDMPTIRHFMHMSSRRYFDRAVNHPNPLIRAVSIYTPFDRAKWRRPRSVLTDPEDDITLAIRRKHEHLKLLHSTRPQFRPRRRGPRRVPRPPDPSISSVGPRAGEDD